MLSLRFSEKLREGKEKRISEAQDKKSDLVNPTCQNTEVSIFSITVGDQIKTVMKENEISIRNGQSLLYKIKF